MLSKEQIDKLNFNNYQVDNEDGHYYLCNGIESLDNYASEIGVNNFDLYLYILNNGYYVEPITGETITMI